jgi:hypothetical protein
MVDRIYKVAKQKSKIEKDRFLASKFNIQNGDVRGDLF